MWIDRGPLASGIPRASIYLVRHGSAFATGIAVGSDVQPTAGGYQFFQNTTCTGTPWSGTGTDANGVFRLSNNMTATLAAGANPVFNQFGVAVQTGTLRVTGPTGGSMTVSVEASGRVRIP